MADRSPTKPKSTPKTIVLGRKQPSRAIGVAGVWFLAVWLLLPASGWFVRALVRSEFGGSVVAGVVLVFAIPGLIVLLDRSGTVHIDAKTISLQGALLRRRVSFEAIKRVEKLRVRRSRIDSNDAVSMIWVLDLHGDDKVLLRIPEHSRHDPQGHVAFVLAAAVHGDMPAISDYVERYGGGRSVPYYPLHLAAAIVIVGVGVSSLWRSQLNLFHESLLKRPADSYAAGSELLEDELAAVSPDADDVVQRFFCRGHMRLRILAEDENNSEAMAGHCELLESRSCETYERCADPLEAAE